MFAEFPVSQFISALQEAEHQPYIERTLVYLLITQIPGMKLELTREMYEEAVKNNPNLETHFCISDDGDTYTVEMRMAGDEPHRENEKEN